MLVQKYFEIPANTHKKDILRSIILLPKGHLIQILIRLLIGNGDKIHLTIKDYEHSFYPESPNDKLSTKGFVDIDAECYEIPHDKTPITVEGYNKDRKQKALLKIDFALLPNSTFEELTKIQEAYKSLGEG